MINKNEVKDIYELSPLQKGMLFHYMHDEGKPAYFEQVDFTLEGEIDKELFNQSFNRLLEKHDIFRTVFLYEKVNQPVQIVLKKRLSTIRFENVEAMDQKEQYIEDFKMKDREMGFDLSSDLLIRFALFQTEKDKYRLIWSFHHILMDGWCLGLVLDDLLSVYGQLRTGTVSLPRKAMQYREYIRYLADKDQSESETYWKNYLKGFDQLTKLPGNMTGTPFLYTQKEIFYEMDQRLTKGIEMFAKSVQVTQNTVFRALWGLLLQRYNNTDDIVFGTIVSGRPHEIPNVEEIVGLFINTVPVRVTGQQEETFIELVERLHEASVGVQEHIYMSLADIQSGSELTSGLFTHLVAFENFPLDTDQVEEMSKQLGFAITDSTTFEQTNYDFNLLVLPGDEWVLKLSYNANVHEESTLLRLLQHLCTITDQVIRDPQILLKDIEIVQDEEKAELSQWSKHLLSYPNKNSIQTLFEQQVAAAPHQRALVGSSGELTYAELNCRANQLARYLRKVGVQHGDKVGISLGRDLDLYVGILAILKAGAAYVPLDPSYPAERLTYLFEDTQLSVLVTEQKLAARFPQGKAKIINLDSAIGEVKEESSKNLELHSSGEDLAYVMYTSGSTGQPKGILTSHRNVIKTVCNNGYLEILPEDRLLQLSNYAFDGSTFDIFGALLNGATLVIVTEDTLLNLEQLSGWIKEQRISISFMTTALFNTLVDLNLGSLSGLRKILFGGEKVSVGHVKKAISYLGKDRLLHVYGPTETTVFATCYAINEEVLDSDTVPIGRPIGNTETYVLDRQQKPVPIGIPGELYIGGAGLAKGYFQRPELTAERFIPVPWNKENDERLYRTGDLVKYLPSGDIEFLDRLDHQVKIRGYRIELGEIEARLREHPDVKDVNVNVSDSKQLTAYVVLHQSVLHGDSWTAMMKSYLGERLPGYMIPTQFVGLDQWPLTPNGKIDKKALLMLDNSKRSRYEAPANQLEEQICEIWKVVLQVEQVGTQDNFFELGGHSLKAMMFISRAMKLFDVRIPVKEVFLKPTVKELARYIEHANQNAVPAITSSAPREHYPVSSAQRRMYALHLVETSQKTYNMPLFLRVQGDLDVNKLRQVFQMLLARHESFRTSFHFINGELIQKISSDIEVNMEVNQAQDEKSLISLMKTFIRPFQLDTAPLCRFGVIQAAANEHVILIDMHHIISDGSSISTLIHEIAQLYIGRSLPPLPLQYRDFALWQQSFAKSDAYLNQEKYWLQQLSGTLPVLEFPTDYVRPVIQQFNGDIYYYRLNDRLSQKLKKLGDKENKSLFMILLAGYYAFLYKYTGNEDILVGTPIAGRNHSDLESVVGMFVNTMVLRGKLEGNKTFGELSDEVQENLLTAYENTEYPLEDLLDKLDYRRDLSRNPLFDTLFVLQNIQTSDLILPDCTVTQEQMEWENSRVDLTWTLTETEGLEIVLEYNNALFKVETIERMLNHYENILQQVVDHPDSRLADLTLITEQEEVKVLEMGVRRISYPNKNSIQTLFEQQVAAAPHQRALVGSSGELTYAELNWRANQLARYLRKVGVQHGDKVGISLGRDLDLYVGILAILKAGAAYVPLDPSYPAERLTYLFEDTQLSVLVTEQKLAARFPQGKAKIINLDSAIGEVKEESGKNLELHSLGEDLAYVMYTSGSTGQPKGILTSHRNVIKTVRNNGYLEILPEDRILQLSNYAFDGSTFDIFGALLNGATLVIVTEDTLLNLEQLSGWIKEQRISVSFMTTALFNTLVDLNLGSLSGLRKILFGGEKVSVGHVKKAISYLGKDRLLHVYGPTETTVFATCYAINEEVLDSDTVPIGRPIGNTETYVLDRQQKPVPIGVPGELYIGGAGLAKGYFQRPELTAERFIPVPWNKESDERLYRTGDLVKYLPSGDIEFLDRLDHQVKIRGYRIELGEIEARLREHPDVKDVIVVATEEKQLIAYLTLVNNSSETNAWRSFLQDRLPNFMIPAAFMILKNFPINANGKVDRKNLPEYSEPNTVLNEYKAPRGYKEELLAEIWKDVLRVERVGIDDNFFDYGGDSIKGMQLIAKLSRYDWKIQMKDLYSNPTIAELIPHLIEMSPASPSFNQVISGEVPLTPIQRWMIELLPEEIEDININVTLSSDEGWDQSIVHQTIQLLMKHHDGLRMQYRKQGDGYIQINQDTNHLRYGFHTFDLTHYSQSEATDRMAKEIHQLNKATNLSTGPMMKVSIIQTKQTEYLILSVHHLIMDDVSANILLDDFLFCYQQLAKGASAILPPKTTSYKEWSEQLQKYAVSDDLMSELHYWITMANTPVEALPKDNPSPALCQLGDMDVVLISIDKEEMQLLSENIGRESNADMYEILLTTLGIVVSDWAGSENILVNLERHGREDIQENLDVSRTLGWFNAHSPILLPMKIKDFYQAADQVHDAMKCIPNKGIGYGILRYLTPDQYKDRLVYKMEPEISFNYHGRVNQRLGAGFAQAIHEIGNSFTSKFPVPFPLYVNAIIIDGTLEVRFGYNKSVFERKTIERVSSEFKSLLKRHSNKGILIT